MKRFRFLMSGTVLFLAACGVLLPQTSAQEDDGQTISPTSEGVTVEEVVEYVEVVPIDAGESGPTTVEIVGGDESALREFVARYLGASYPGQGADHITIYLGSLPPETSQPIPIPDGAHVVGSVRQTLYDVLQVILDAPMAAQDLMAYYETALSAAGWETAAGYGSGGFVSSGVDQNYCWGQETSLYLFAAPLADGNTSAHIYIQTGPGYSICNPGQGSGDDVSARLPVLKNPPEMRSTGGGGGGSSDSDAYNETHIEGDLSAAETAAYYNDQLAAAGWMLVDSGDTDSLSWSTWTFTGEDGSAWTGTLFVSDIPPGSGKLYAYVRIESAP